MIETLDELAEAWWNAEDVAARDRLAHLLRTDPALQRSLRRGALSPEHVRDAGSYRRLLALTELHYRTEEQRECIVTLVVLRHAAAQHGIDPLPLLQDASLLASAELRPCFASALQHTEGEVLHTVRAFGK
jgi:hypothetical protein